MDGTIAVGVLAALAALAGAVIPKLVEARNERKRTLLEFGLEDMRNQIKAIEDLEEGMGLLLGALRELQNSRSGMTDPFAEQARVFYSRYARFRGNEDLYSSLDQFQAAADGRTAFSEAVDCYNKALEKLAQHKKAVLMQLP